ncbi:hypothetical protein GCM10007304_00390 [Rhodococcoides trifolii]|uniref:O-antigen ligase-related domain-containing protein n=1 Tax=Rhodococcoides trifolii TaxID=908250 RepID=A0A917CME5_9NOCA|nr:O-antigen ligase family protein [Rhodococcus trifolii]GGF90425.1 hypothetical protein GCM10007304_00390 [Rhodococcus trifolii]
MSNELRHFEVQSTRDSPTSAAIDQVAVPWLLKAVPVLTFVLPADMIVGPFGANGYLAMMAAIALFALWAVSAVWGLHDPVRFRNPARVGLALFWIASVASYVNMAAGPADAVGRAAADRWLLMLMGWTALVLVTAETVRTRHAAMVLVRCVVLGATVCAVVSLYQFVVGSDPLDYVRAVMIGMSDNGGATTFQNRGLLLRVAGNTFSPIELGMVMSMVLPLAVWRALYDNRGRAVSHWIQCALIAFACVMTVSRSAVIGLVIAGVVTIPFLPPQARKWSSIAVPGALVTVFLAVPGLIATMAALFSSSSDTDPSIANRVNNYPRVQALVLERPVLGMGPATFIQSDARGILDNQYLQTSVEMGLIGLVALVLFFAIPLVASLACAVWVKEPVLRLLAASIASAMAVALIGSATFDSLSFPVFKLVVPLFVGLSGAVWIMSRAEPGRGAPSSVRTVER